MMDAVYVIAMVGMFLITIRALRLFTRGQGRRAGRED